MTKTITFKLLWIIEIGFNAKAFGIAIFDKFCWTSKFGFEVLK